MRRIAPRRPARPLTAAAALACCAGLAACGNERNRLGSLRAQPSPRIQTLDYDRVGLSVALPRNVAVQESAAPGVFRAPLGDAVVAGYAYRREQDVPRDAEQLDAALRRLRRSTAERSDSWVQRSAKTTEIGGARAIELVGDQTISRARLRVRSIHVFRGNGEYVVELLAPRDDFRRLDAVFAPLVRRTLEVTGDVRRGR